VGGGGGSLPYPKQHPANNEPAAAKVLMAERRAAKAAAVAEKSTTAQATAEAACCARDTANFLDFGGNFFSGLDGLASRRRNQPCSKCGGAVAERRLMQRAPCWWRQTPLMCSGV
jgi:formamidopyrimidine-DNA glycosylase